MIDRRNMLRGMALGSTLLRQVMSNVAIKPDPRFLIVLNSLPVS
ncbi:MAG: hypothetical protein P8M80_13065 [Pirellulaceae bacterium]|nr:hypothetical protein [Pirellulaceae bacterium]